MKRIAAFVTVLCCAVMLYAAVPVCAEEAVVPVASSASAAVLYEPSSGRVLYEKNAHTAMPMASTTKLMTALVAVEMLAPDAVLTASAEALAVEGSCAGLRVGDTVTRDDLLYALLLSSGNDAANVAALSAAGSYEAFAARMNEKARALGMHHTHFVTPSGLDADGHGASAYDMALLAAAVLKNETLRTVCATTDKTVTFGDRTVSLHNHNRLLSSYDGAIGMKTGYTSLAGRCLVSAAQRDGVTLIAVTLHCANDWEEHTLLLDEGFSLMTTVTVEPPTVAPVTVFGGEAATVTVAALPIIVTVLRGDEADLETAVHMPAYVWAPLQPGETLGTIQVRLRGAVIAQTPLTAVVGVKEQQYDTGTSRVWLWFRRLLREVTTR